MYHGIRRDTSLLLSEGHWEARNYTIGYLWSEARIVHQRHSLRAKTDAVVLQTAIMTILSKESRQTFVELIEDLDSGY